MPRTRISSPPFGDDPYQIPIERLRLSMRGYNCLRRSRLLTVGHVLGKSEAEIRTLRNFRNKSFEELRERLAELGILPLDAPWDSRPR